MKIDFSNIFRDGFRRNSAQSMRNRSPVIFQPSVYSISKAPDQPPQRPFAGGFYFLLKSDEVEIGFCRNALQNWLKSAHPKPTTHTHLSWFDTSPNCHKNSQANWKSSFSILSRIFQPQRLGPACPLEKGRRLVFNLLINRLRVVAMSWSALGFLTEVTRATLCALAAWQWLRPWPNQEGFKAPFWG